MKIIECNLKKGGHSKSTAHLESYWIAFPFVELLSLNLLTVFSLFFTVIYVF